MYKCIKCNHLYQLRGPSCDQCGYSPPISDGFIVLSPKVAVSNDGFPKEGFHSLVDVEDGSFWFRVRNLLILWLIKKYFDSKSSFLEIGCGTGYVLNGIANLFPSMKLTGSEIYTTGLKYTKLRVNSDIELIQMDARDSHFVEEFDVVGAFDVIEHIDDDELVLKNIYYSLKVGGGCILTVPQHKWLWSGVDEAACHKRRYSEKELHFKVEKAGFKIVFSNSFMFFLLPIMYLSRKTKMVNSDDRGIKELSISPLLNFFFYIICYIELFLIKLGLKFSYGGSRVMVIMKVNNTSVS